MSYITLRSIEVGLYALISLLPYLFLALYPFKDKIRFSRGKLVGLVVLLSLIQVILWGWTVLTPYDETSRTSLICTGLYFIFYFLVVRAHMAQTAFTLLMLYNINNFIEIASKCIESFIFPDLAVQDYRWSFTLIILILEVIILVPFFQYIKLYYAPIFQRKISAVTWRYLWIIPATFYVTWYHHLYASGKSSLELALVPSNTFYLLLMSLGSIFIYHLVVKLIIVMDNNAQLAENNHVLLIQHLQYNTLQERIHDARRAKHDIRHHISILKSYAEKRDYESLTDYLNQYQKTMPDDRSIVFCENLPANALLLYFAQIAKDNNVDFAVQANIPADLAITENDLSVLMGNLLENALDACIAQKEGKRKIRIKAKTNQSAFFLTVDNTFDGLIRQTLQGDFLSTKENGSGIGLISVQQIVDKYEGTLQIHHNQSEFRASVMLNMLH